jgi:two-component system nitrogen regulation response regulator GlnG
MNERSDDTAEAYEATKASHVLVVDDDDGMRALVREALCRNGYRVTEAKDGAALARCVDAARRGFGSFDAIITDIRMPGGSGMEGLALLRDHDPHTPVILMTGFPDADIHEDAIRFGAAELFEKPFPVRRLVEALRQLVPPTT